jgi:hypothetical protein
MGKLEAYPTVIFQHEPVEGACPDSRGTLAAERGKNAFR